MSFDTSLLGERIAEAMTNDKIPSLSLAVLHHGDVVHAQGFGVTSVEDGGLPVTPSTLFRIASTSKSLTATVLLQLVGGGRIDLDAPVKAYLPWFTLSDVKASETVTVRQLMSNQSGLPADNDAVVGGGSDALEHYVRHEVPRYALAADPGKAFIYSNPGINVAGYLAESVSGVPFAQLMQERIFDPLGMARSTYDPLVAMTYPLAQRHYLDEKGQQRVRHIFSDMAAWQPAGGAFSTALDMAKFAQLLLDGGSSRGQQVLGNKELAEMTRPAIRTFWPLFSPTASYGLMMFVDNYKGQLRWSHPGGADGFLHTFALLPDTRSAVIIQTNGGASSATGRALSESIFDELLGLPAECQPPSPQPDPDHWDAYIGTFANDTGVYEGAPPIGRVTVSIEGDDLVAEHEGTRYVLTCVAPDFYHAPAIAPESAMTPSSDPDLMIGFYPPSRGVVDWVSVNGQPCRRV